MAMKMAYFQGGDPITTYSTNWEDPPSRELYSPLDSHGVVYYNPYKWPEKQETTGQQPPPSPPIARSGTSICAALGFNASGKRASSANSNSIPSCHHQTFQVPKMEGFLSLIRLVWG